MRELSDKRILYVTECFNNIKTLKLYGWEQKFKTKIEEIYQEENELSKVTTKREHLSNVFEGILKSTMFFLTFAVYAYFGNALVSSTLLAAHKGIHYLNMNISRLNNLYKSSFEIQESMERINKLFISTESQKGLVKNSKDTTEKLAVSVQGNFSYGVSPIKDKSEKDEG